MFASGWASLKTLMTEVLAPVPAATCKGVRFIQSCELGASGHSSIILATRDEGGLNRAMAWRMVMPLKEEDLATILARYWNVFRPSGSARNIQFNFCQSFASMRRKRMTRVDDAPLEAGFEDAMVDIMFLLER